MIPASELRHLPKVTYDWLATKVTGRRPALPWWPMPVIPKIEEFLLSKDCDVVEFGSGGSTKWLADRSRSVTAIEDNVQWFDRVRVDLESERYENVTIKFLGGESYYNLSWCREGVAFDLAVIDGSWRWHCVNAVLPRMKTGGIVYLDNSDSDKDASLYGGTDMDHEAQKILQNYADRNKSAVLSRYAGLINGELHAGEGMLLRLP